MRKFFKLLKYDFFDNFGTFALVNGLLCVLVIMSKFTFSKSGAFLPIIFLLAIFGIIASIVFLIIVIIKLFHSRLFSSDGYLTFCLPVSLDAILISRILVGASYVILNWIIIATVIAALNINAIDIAFYIDLLVNVESIYIFTNCILETIVLIVILLLTLAILNTGKITRFRTILGIIIFMFLFSIGNMPYGMLLDDNYFQGKVQQTTWIIILSVTMIKIIIYYLCARYLIKNKLEI